MITSHHRGALISATSGGAASASVVVQSLTAVLLPEVADVAVPGPAMMGTSGVVAGGSGTTRTAEIAGFTYQAGDVLWMQVATRMAGTTTVSMPTNEGWTLDQSEVVAGRSDWHFYKRWGQGGGIVDNPTVVVTSSIGGVWLVGMSVLRGCKPTGLPYTQKLWRSNESNLVMVAGPVGNPVGQGTRTCWFYNSGNDNDHGDQTRGLLGYSGQTPAGNGSAISFCHDENVDSSVVNCSMWQRNQGPQTSRTLCVVFSIA